MGEGLGWGGGSRKGVEAACKEESGAGHQQ